MDEFLPVEPAEFLYGDHQRLVTIGYSHWIAKYPVTNLQYARFIENDGYTRREFWNNAGWKWLEQEHRREHPRYGQNGELSNSIFPVVGVSWYEADAYARWLDSKLRVDQDTKFAALLQDPKYRVRLPTEQEWERAARGTDGREYPWGQKFSEACANVRGGREKMNGTTAVATYPLGASPVGAWDMSGNLWEWTVSPWSKDDKNLALRGGSWIYFPRNARCVARSTNDPDVFDGCVAKITVDGG